MQEFVDEVIYNFSLRCRGFFNFSSPKFFICFLIYLRKIILVYYINNNVSSFYPLSLKNDAKQRITFLWYFLWYTHSSNHNITYIFGILL